ncbi:Transmembrane emp24 domain-containing protein [Actinidia chinensis var. chinensis]|uniref:Transmembrane emp24 domain-containing protein n=1 Tax=Actinidia chinensis var. chinensis TaxID=1590841 RepID=A0A2R6RBP5_ACTCC|nr:Transmembrane emp24 domain-containing protein [Actinidia chinensis var. chinensis]
MEKEYVEEFMTGYEFLVALFEREPSDDENGAEEQEIGQKKEAEDEKEELAADQLEIILLGEILDNKNQVIEELEQEREKHKEERHAWEKEKTSLEDNIRIIKGMFETFTGKSLQWQEERSQLHAQLDAARDSLQRYQELMHHCDHYNYY